MNIVYRNAKKRIMIKIKSYEKGNNNKTELE